MIRGFFLVGDRRRQEHYGVSRSLSSFPNLIVTFENMYNQRVLTSRGNLSRVFSFSLHVIRVILILLANMKASSHGLIRSSSVTFSIAPQPDIRDHLCDDMTIAQELLIGPKPPRRSNSLTGLSLRGFDSSNDNASSISPIEQTEDRPPRRVILTSNTWTTSSGDVLSDQDEVDDRTTFIQEYNRLAKKVCTSLLSKLFLANQPS
jgi:hypothetical protein